MKILKKILYVLLAIIVLWLLVAAVVSGDVKYEKSISINASPDKVWSHTNSVRAIDEWSPWNDKDPNLKKEWSGTTGQVGEKMAWEGNSNVGKGSQTLTKIDPAAKRIDTEMKFFNPYESEGKAYVTVIPEGSGSKATWGFTSQIPYPFSVMKLFMNMEEAVGKDYQIGLERLKNISEK